MAALGLQLPAEGQNVCAVCSVSNKMGIMVQGCHLVQRLQAKAAAEQEDIKAIKAPHHRTSAIVTSQSRSIVFNNKGNNSISIDLTS